MKTRYLAELTDKTTKISTFAMRFPTLEYLKSFDYTTCKS